MTAELNRELMPGHLLHGERAEPLAKEESASREIQLTGLDPQNHERQNSTPIDAGLMAERRLGSDGCGGQPAGGSASAVARDVAADEFFPCRLMIAVAIAARLVRPFDG